MVRLVKTQISPYKSRLASAETGPILPLPVPKHLATINQGQQ